MAGDSAQSRGFLLTFKIFIFMTFTINGNEFLIVRTEKSSRKAWGVFKSNPKGLSPCLYLAYSNAELNGYLKRLFLKEIYRIRI